ncbi:hypothetical protein BZA70DRAFT_114854 [Myxozyma melibiosi]|uniref:Membrane-associated protein n=1 Tax=Myxozyma melibiosi TaxID=54550 RepID=A0ABR1FAC7_9ASCO
MPELSGLPLAIPAIGSLRRQTAGYPSWCLSFFVFAFLQAVFALIPLCVVAYFIFLVRQHNSGAPVSQSYRVLVVSSTLTTLIVLLSVVTVLVKFHRAGAGPVKDLDESTAEELEEQADLLLRRIESETRIRDSVDHDPADLPQHQLQQQHQQQQQQQQLPATIEIDVAVSGERWPLIFVVGQIVMALFWSVLFVYVMSLTGGISTSCSIENPQQVCKDLALCSSYETACRLVNLIVVSCALDACFWISGTISMFINSAITYRKRAISSFEALSSILRQHHPSTTFTMASNPFSSFRSARSSSFDSAHATLTTTTAYHTPPSAALRVLTPTLGPTSFWSRFKRRLIELTTGEDYDPATGTFSYSLHSIPPASSARRQPLVLDSRASSRRRPRLSFGFRAPHEQQQLQQQQIQLQQLQQQQQQQQQLPPHLQPTLPATQSSQLTPPLSYSHRHHLSFAKNSSASSSSPAASAARRASSFSSTMYVVHEVENEDADDPELASRARSYAPAPIRSFS